MRKSAIIIAMAVAVLGTASDARADGFLSLDSVYVDARGHVYIDGDARDAAGFPVGADVEVQLDLAASLDFYAYTGFLYGLAADVTNFNIPLVGGLVYNFSQGSKTPTVGAGFGAAINHINDDTNFDGTLEVHGGYQTSSIRFKLGVQFFDIAELGDTVTGFASVGFDLR